MIPRVALLLLVASAVGGLQVQAQQAPAAPDHAAHSSIAPATLKWSPLGPSLSFAVLSGSPQEEGSPFVMRLKLAAGAQVTPHWHPIDEHVTVLSGTFHMGTGERFDKAAATALVTGTYAVMPKTTIHYAWVDGETVLQIHGVGPFKTFFVGQPAKPSAP